MTLTDTQQRTEFSSAPLDTSRGLALQIFVDRAAIEVYANEGEQCGSLRFVPQNSPFPQLTLTKTAGASDFSYSLLVYEL